jgi:hypothetical protein
MSSRCMSLLPRTTLHSDSEHCIFNCKTLEIFVAALHSGIYRYTYNIQDIFSVTSEHAELLHMRACKIFLVAQQLH